MQHAFNTRPSKYGMRKCVKHSMQVCATSPFCCCLLPHAKYCLCQHAPDNKPENFIIILNGNVNNFSKIKIHFSNMKRKCEKRKPGEAEIWPTILKTQQSLYNTRCDEKKKFNEKKKLKSSLDWSKV